MIVYLVRHATPEVNTESSDPGLSEYGKVEARMAADTLKHAKPAVIYHSVKARARQTAEILSGVIGAPLEEAKGLKPNDDPNVWIEKLSGLSHDEVMVVGHLPFVGVLADMLLGDKAKEYPVKVEPATVIILVKTNEGWEFKGAHTP